MAIKEVKGDFQFSKDFGFTGSAGGKSPRQNFCEGGMVGYAKGGGVDPDAAQDRAMVAKGVHQHEARLHKGATETPLKLARGGMPGLPKKMRAKAEVRRSPIGNGQRRIKGALKMAAPSVNKPPMVPETTQTPPGLNPGGAIPYGVQPGPEPSAGFMRRGGRVKK